MFIAGGAESQKYIQDGIAANMGTYFTEETLPNYFKWVSKEELDAFQLKHGEFYPSNSAFPTQFLCILVYSSGLA